MSIPTAGQIIRNFREQASLTQDELAQIIHITKGKLSHWEDDATIPRPSMVDRLIGALRLSEEQAAVLKQAVEDAQRQREQEQAAAQIMIDEQNAEEERLVHRSKALKLLWIGLGGFIAGCLLSLLTGSWKDDPWYFTPAIGVLVMGIPFGWSILTDKSETYQKDPYYHPNEQGFYLIIKLFFFVLKFIGAYLIGTAAFPVCLLYHAYKAGKKGSLYRKGMCVLFMLAVLFVGSIVFIILCSALPRA